MLNTPDSLTAAVAVELGKAGFALVGALIGALFGSLIGFWKFKRERTHDVLIEWHRYALRSISELKAEHRNSIAGLVRTASYEAAQKQFLLMTEEALAFMSRRNAGQLFLVRLQYQAAEDKYSPDEIPDEFVRRGKIAYDQLTALDTAQTTLITGLRSLVKPPRELRRGKHPADILDLKLKPSRRFRRSRMARQQQAKTDTAPRDGLPQ